MKQSINFHQFPIGSKIQSFDKDGYFVQNACGKIVSHIGDKDAIIKTWEDIHFSTVSNPKIVLVERIEDFLKYQ